MSVARSAAEDHTLGLIRKLKSDGKLGKPMDDETARELLRTPPTGLSRAASDGDTGSMNSPGADAKGPGPLAKLPPAAAAASADKAMRAGSANGGLPPSMTGMTAVQVLEVLVEDAAAFQASLSNHVKLSRDHMQRSLLQLFEDTLRENFGGSLDMSLRPQGGGASVMGLSTTMGAATPSGSAARALRAMAGGSPALGKPMAINSSAPSLRPVDKSGQVAGNTLSRRGTDSMTDFVIPDATRQQLAVNINTVLDHELQRLSSLIQSEVGKVTSHVKNLSDRMTTAEEELMHASVELDVSAQRLADATSELKRLGDRVCELEEHCRTKDRQMDLLREQVARRNENLDQARTEFRKEVLRYQSRVFDLEAEVDSITVRAQKGEHVTRRAHAGSAGLTHELFDPALEDALREANEKHDEEIRRLKAEHAREKRELTITFNGKIAERDHEIIELRGRTPTPGPGQTASRSK